MALRWEWAQELKVRKKEVGLENQEAGGMGNKGERPGVQSTRATQSFRFHLRKVGEFQARTDTTPSGAQGTSPSLCI